MSRYVRKLILTKKIEMQIRSGSIAKVSGYLYKIGMFSSEGHDRIQRISETSQGCSGLLVIISKGSARTLCSQRIGGNAYRIRDF